MSFLVKRHPSEIVPTTGKQALKEIAAIGQRRLVHHSEYAVKMWEIEALISAFLDGRIHESLLPDTLLDDVLSGMYNADIYPRGDTPRTGENAAESSLLRDIKERIRVERDRF